MLGDILDQSSDTLALFKIIDRGDFSINYLASVLWVHPGLTGGKIDNPRVRVDLEY
jgi:hypothetical protein